MNIVSCTTWVKRGIAASIPEKVELTQEELNEVIQQTKLELEDLKGESEEQNSQNTSQQINEPMDQDDEFDLKDYDNEDGSLQCKVSDLVMPSVDGKDPLITGSDKDSDSDKEDEIIKSDDNLVLIGRVDGDSSVLEVYVYNEKEGSFYCHHDMYLSAFPLCIEWINFDPSDPKPGNLAAIGLMSPVIEVWDLDIINVLEPAFKLGCKASKKKKREAVGHTDAVLDLAWNIEYKHILASASVDHTVLLWDLENGKPATKLLAFDDKIQSIEWNQKANSCLLTGCADKYVRLFDCSTDNNFKAWQTSGEVDRVTWNKADSNICFISTNCGTVECIDIRKENDVLWKTKIDEKEISGLCMSQSAEMSMLVAASGSGDITVWDVTDFSFGLTKQICHKTGNLGTILSLSGNPDNPYVFVAGGDNKSHNLRIFDFSKQTQIDAPE